MNPRIKELAKQSGLDDQLLPLDEWDHQELEKFVDLLVCALSYDIMNIHGGDPERIALAAKSYGVEI